MDVAPARRIGRLARRVIWDALLSAQDEKDDVPDAFLEHSCAMAGSTMEIFVR